jgi:predicted signal transduction protein with EAL and GGDEF domain
VLIGASIGIEFIKNADLSTDDLLRNADLALYRAKAEGKGRFCVFREEFHASLDRRRQLELELRAALHNDEFEVYYQPQIDIKSGGICGFEALVRWNSPTRGQVAPAEFIGLSEEIGLIDDLGAWVLRRACLDMVRIPDAVSVAVNLSPVQFKSEHLVETVRSALKDSGLAPHRLELEVTEGVMISDTRRAQSMLESLKKLGVSIVLDDFGTGYSSLSYIRHFPFNKVKIDQSFVRDLDKANDGLAIIRAVVAMCAGMGIVSIAEGVETWEHFEVLKAEQCDRAQGYLYSKPIPFKDARAFFESRNQARRA